MLHCAGDGQYEQLAKKHGTPVRALEWHSISPGLPIVDGQWPVPENDEQATLIKVQTDCMLQELVLDSNGYWPALAWQPSSLGAAQPQVRAYFINPDDYWVSCSLQLIEAVLEVAAWRFRAASMWV